MKNKKEKKKSKTRLMKFLKGLWIASVIGSLGMVLEAACQLYLPKLMGKIIDNGVTPVINETMSAADGSGYHDSCFPYCNSRRYYLYEAFVRGKPEICGKNKKCNVQKNFVIFF